MLLLVMYIDVHCHPFDLNKIAPLQEIKASALASAWSIEEFLFNEKLTILNSFGIHPQLEAVINKDPLSLAVLTQAAPTTQSLKTLEKLAAEKRLAAVGECGFDLFNDEYKATEAWQNEVFAAQLEIALKYDLLIVLHVRRAMHKIFAFAKKLKQCRAVIFHSWQGTPEEGQSLIRRGVNVYFSFGNTILNGHKQQLHCCALFPADRLLTETDAPYQPSRGKEFSSWDDLPGIVEKIASLRNMNSKELENQLEENFISLHF